MACPLSGPESPSPVTAVLVLSMLLAGCTGTYDDPLSNVSPVQYDTLVIQGASDVVEGGLSYSHRNVTYMYYATIISSRSGAERLNEATVRRFETPADDPVEFVRETNYDRSYLVVVQIVPSSTTPDYGVDSVRRDGDEVGIRLSKPTDDVDSTGDQSAETLFVRVSDGDDPPTRAVVEIENGITFDSTRGVVVR